jgi:hypothetical protein
MVREGREGTESQTLSAGRLRGRVSGNHQCLGSPATSTYPRLQVLSSRFSFRPRAVAKETYYAAAKETYYAVAKETYYTHAVAAATCHVLISSPLSVDG